jgi:hypothetical protein
VVAAVEGYTKEVSAFAANSKVDSTSERAATAQI